MTAREYQLGLDYIGRLRRAYVESMEEMVDSTAELLCFGCSAGDHNCSKGTFHDVCEARYDTKLPMIFPVLWKSVIHEKIRNSFMSSQERNLERDAELKRLFDVYHNIQVTVHLQEAPPCRWSTRFMVRVYKDLSLRMASRITIKNECSVPFGCPRRASS